MVLEKKKKKKKWKESRSVWYERLIITLTGSQRQKVPDFTMELKTILGEQKSMKYTQPKICV